MPRYPLAALASLVALLLILPAVGMASGGESIASAPSLNLGSLESGGGNYIEYWRVQVYGGDVITVDADLSDNGGDMVFDLFAPSVDDYSFSHAEPLVSSERLRPEKQQFTLKVPSTGLDILAVCRSHQLH
jgi:hypothetical protein